MAAAGGAGKRASVSAGLAGDQVLELTRFADKQSYLTSRTAFLQSLPPVLDLVTAPLPPQPCSVSKGQLEEWWKEHDRIEEEVRGFDMGDLERFRGLARDKSKQALSARDTDVIEITLTTLFAVDRLLQLLRSRRRGLGLLGYRLQWEEAVATTWSAHKQLVEELLPSFLQKARWTLPSAVASPGRHSSDDPALTLASSSLSASTSSLSASTSSSRRLSSSSSTIASTSAAASASAMSRTMHLQLLSLSLSQLLTHLSSLTSSHLPTTSTLLDKLIDTSPTPLPDAFLDEQDRLEAEVGRATKGLRGFAETLVKVWKTADEVFWSGCEVERDADKLTREIEEAVALLSSSSADDAPFGPRLTRLSSTLASLQAILTSLPTPTHPSLPPLPSYASHHPLLLKALRKNLSRASTSLSRAQEAEERCKQAEEACREAERVRGEVERVRGLVARAREGLDGLEGRKPRGVEEKDAEVDGWSEVQEGEKEWESEWDKVLEPLLPLLLPPSPSPSSSVIPSPTPTTTAATTTSTPLSITVLLLLSTSTLAALPSSVPAPLRRTLRDSSHSLRAEAAQLLALKNAEERRREGVMSAREVKRVVEELRVEEGRLKVEVEEGIRRRAWREDEQQREGEEEGGAMMGQEAEERVAALKAKVERTVPPLLEELEAFLSSSSPSPANLISPCPLLSHLHTLSSPLSSSLVSLTSSAALLTTVEAQTAAVRAIDADAREIDAALERVGAAAGEVLDEEGVEVAALRKRREELEREVAGLVERVEELEERVGKVSFLSTTATSSSSSPSSSTHPNPPAVSTPPAPSPAPDPSLPLDLTALDSSIRLFLNRTTASLHGRIDDIRQRLRVVEHEEKARGWDEEAERVEAGVRGVEEGVERGRAGLEQEGVDEDTITAVLDTLSALELSSPSSSLATLANLLTGLLASLESSSPPFNFAHSLRSARVSALEARLKAAQTAADQVRAEGVRMREEREERVRNWEEERDAVAEKLRAVEEAIQAMARETEEVKEKVEETREEGLAAFQQFTSSSSDPSSASFDSIISSSATTATSSRASLAFLTARLDTHRAALSLLTAQLESLLCSLPSPHAPPSLTLASASLASSSASTAALFAASVLDKATRALALLDVDVVAWKGAAEVARTKRRVEKLAEGLERERREVGEVEDRARGAMEEVEREVAELKEKREAVFRGEGSGEETDSAQASAGEKKRELLERLTSRLKELSSAGERVEEPIATLAAKVATLLSSSSTTPSSSEAEELSELLEDLRAQSSSFPLVVESAKAQLELLEVGVQDLEAAARDVKEAKEETLQQRKAAEKTTPLSHLSLDGAANVDREDDPLSSSPNDHAEDDPFSSQPSLLEPVEVRTLRRYLETSTARDWLDSSAVLVLPTSADAADVERQTTACRVQWDAIGEDALVWTADADALREEVERGEKEAGRVRELARFGEKVVKADEALSNLLDSIDASAPDGLPPPLEDAEVLPLPTAISTASDTVTSVRLAAIPLVDDARVDQAIRRIEETWSEMMSMVEPPRASSSASTASTASQRRRDPRLSDTSLSRSSSRTSTRTPSAQGTSRPLSVRLSTRPPSRSSLPGTRPRPASSQATSRPVGSSFLVPSTPRKGGSTADAFSTPTPRRRVQSGLPLPSSATRRAVSPLPKAPITVIHAFSFSTPKKHDDMTRSRSSMSSNPRRSGFGASSSTSSRRDSIASTSTSSGIFSPQMERISSASTTSSSRRDSLAGSISSLSVNNHRSPRLNGSSRSTPPRRSQMYRPNKKNKLDREVGAIVNGLNIHVPIEMAEGRWTDESGQYIIGGRPYFCRILRSKQVMVRVGGGWQNLLQFILTHFGVADGLAISPSTATKRTLVGAEPEWISSATVREQLAASTSSSPLRNYLSTSVSSSLGSALSDLSLNTTSLSMSRSFSGASLSAGTPLRRSISGAASLAGLAGSLSPRAAAMATPKSRPGLPKWRP